MLAWAATADRGRLPEGGGAAGGTGVAVAARCSPATPRGLRTEGAAGASAAPMRASSACSRIPTSPPFILASRIAAPRAVAEGTATLLPAAAHAPPHPTPRTHARFAPRYPVQHPGCTLATASRRAAHQPLKGGSGQRWAGDFRAMRTQLDHDSVVASPGKLELSNGWAAARLRRSRGQRAITKQRATPSSGCAQQRVCPIGRKWVERCGGNSQASHARTIERTGGAGWRRGSARGRGRLGDGHGRSSGRRGGGCGVGSGSGGGPAPCRRRWRAQWGVGPRDRRGCALSALRAGPPVAWGRHGGSGAALPAARRGHGQGTGRGGQRGGERSSGSCRGDGQVPHSGGGGGGGGEHTRASGRTPVQTQRQAQMSGSAGTLARQLRPRHSTPIPRLQLE